jgi:hypothetical protein
MVAGPVESLARHTLSPSFLWRRRFSRGLAGRRARKFLTFGIKGIHLPLISGMLVMTSHCEGGMRWSDDGVEGVARLLEEVA